jgi:D-alanyl-D-alanine carboxypeptidase (penicillin-binding protein 5/6)
MRIDIGMKIIKKIKHFLSVPRNGILCLIIFLLLLDLLIVPITTGSIYWNNSTDYSVIKPVHSESLHTTSKEQTDTFKLTELYARYAVLMDADNGRVLIGKSDQEPVPMASTTKIMTCIIALEYGNLEMLCTTSPYAASMPDVQLNALKNEVFRLNDLLYSLMLKSHNDSAVIIAENVAYNYIYQLKTGAAADEYNILQTYDLSFVPDDSYNTSFIGNLNDLQSKTLVGVFATLMNQKAIGLGCEKTHFITPNGLDASDDTGVHSTTAKELALIMSYCIKNQTFLDITHTPSYSFNSFKTNNTGEVSGNSRSFAVTNANAFLNMYDHIISGKTGFTGDAGYCYVCAYSYEGRTFIVSLLACGWPNNKSYKWHDARLLLNWGREQYFNKCIVDVNYPINDIEVQRGLKSIIHPYIKDTCSMLLSETDQVNVRIDVPTKLEAPISTEEVIGTLRVYVNDTLIKNIPVYSQESIRNISYLYYLRKLVKTLIFVDN